MPSRPISSAWHWAPPSAYIWPEATLCAWCVHFEHVILYVCVHACLFVGKLEFLSVNIRYAWVSMYVWKCECMHRYPWVYLYVCMCTYIYVWLQTCINVVCIYIYFYVCINAWMCIYASVNVCTCMYNDCMYVCSQTCIDKCLHICMYMYIHLVKCMQMEGHSVMHYIYLCLWPQC